MQNETKTVTTLNRSQKIMQWISHKQRMEEHKQQQSDNFGIMSVHLLSN
jgi:hypothetical protein